MVLLESLPLWAKILISSAKKTEDRSSLFRTGSQSSELSDVTSLSSGHDPSQTSLISIPQKRHRRRSCFRALGEAN